jgi:hypothetical protein
MTTFTHRGYTVRLKRRNMFGGWTATVSDQSVAQSLFLGRQSGSKAIARMKSFVDLLVEQQAWIEAMQPKESHPKHSRLHRSEERPGAPLRQADHHPPAV